MEEFVINELDFEDKELSLLIKDLKQCSYKQQSTFIDTCVTIQKIWFYCKGNYYKAKDNEYYNSYKLLAKFGFDKKAVSRYKQCFEKFIVGDDGHFTLFPQLYGFTSSKLFELLTLSAETIFNSIDKKLLRPDMTVKQIREYVKSLKDGTDKAEKVVEDTTEINEDDIPLVYDPKQEYEYSYFESKTKNQLLNIVWELQKAYQKLKGEKKNVNQSNK